MKVRCYNKQINENMLLFFFYLTIKLPQCLFTFLHTDNRGDFTRYRSDAFGTLCYYWFRMYSIYCSSFRKDVSKFPIHTKVNIQLKTKYTKHNFIHLSINLLSAFCNDAELLKFLTWNESGESQNLDGM